MEKKLITLVFVALLIGLGGGYGLGYMVYQPQILDFQSDLETIKTDLHDLEALIEETSRNVNVTNWLPSKPKVLVYGEYNISWTTPYGPVLPRCLRGGGMLYVGDYTRICIFLKFSNWTVEYGRVTCSVRCMWSAYSNYTVCAYETLESLNCTIAENLVYACSVESFEVKSPYVELLPILIGSKESKGTTLCSIIVFLTYE